MRSRRSDAEAAEWPSPSMSNSRMRRRSLVEISSSKAVAFITRWAGPQVKVSLSTSVLPEVVRRESPRVEFLGPWRPGWQTRIACDDCSDCAQRITEYQRPANAMLAAPKNFAAGHVDNRLAPRTIRPHRLADSCSRPRHARDAPAGPRDSWEMRRLLVVNPFAPTIFGLRFTFAAALAGEDAALGGRSRLHGRVSVEVGSRHNFGKD